jgi:hypothetical protein
MATVINLNERPNLTTDLEMPEKIRALFEERKAAKREPLTLEVLRKGKGLENLSDEQALKAIESIKKLAAILFEMACHDETTCIDNQQVVHLKQPNKAA